MEEALYQIAKGLTYLHSQKVIHGDLKSGNVLVNGEEASDYHFILTDFGEPQHQLTLTGKFLKRT